MAAVKLSVFDKRLLKLAKHLRTGKLGHKKFDFGEYNVGEFNAKGCGTSGCAIGECPIVFKRYWAFKGRYRGPALKTISPINLGTFGAAGKSGQEFFGLDYIQYARLFVPGHRLSRMATPKQVARNIENFVKERSREAAKNVR
jgi:hypothetical protein